MLAAQPGFSEASKQALQILRDPTLFQWYVVPLFALVMFLYITEISNKNWHGVVAALGAYALEWLAEIGNALLLPITGFAALWTAPSKTAYLILVGINIEITLMFALAGLAFVKLARVFPNRWLLVVCYTLLGVGVECVLNQWGALIWEYKFWSWPNVWPIMLFAYGPFMVFCLWLYDLKSMRTKLAITGGLFAIDVILYLLFTQVYELI